MPNMSYCRFQNTKPDLTDCLDALRDEESLSEEEAKAGKRMFTEFLEFCENMDIIDGFDRVGMEAMFEALCRDN